MSLRDLEMAFGASRAVKTRNRVMFSSIDSTNRVGKRIASFYQRNGAELPAILLIALQQTKGRGRLGNSWLSPRGGIYASLVVPRRGPEALYALPMVVATSLCEELDSVLDGSCRLKWPNDLMVSGRKIGGILIETVGKDKGIAAVIGFGINYSTDLPDTLEATSILRESSNPPSLPSVTMDLVSVVESVVVQRTSLSKVVEQYSRWSLMTVGQETRCRTVAGVESGTFLGFDERGFLRLQTGAGERLISSGHIIEGEGIDPHES